MNTCLAGGLAASRAALFPKFFFVTDREYGGWSGGGCLAACATHRIDDATSEGRAWDQMAYEPYR